MLFSAEMRNKAIIHYSIILIYLRFSNTCLIPVHYFQTLIFRFLLQDYQYPCYCNSRDLILVNLWTEYVRNYFDLTMTFFRYQKMTYILEEYDSKSVNLHMIILEQLCSSMILAVINSFNYLWGNFGRCFSAAIGLAKLVSLKLL